ncbi:MAG: peptidylprolyl isomerase [Ignavibacteriae bacterium]|nr:peptidylprolyl isomerase [Ignavibacteriota bacterium]
MKYKITDLSFFLVLILILFTSKCYSQKEGDRILAIVGYDIILESDLQYQIQLYARQNQLTQINPMLAQQIFQQLLTEKIIYAKAEQDSITIKEDEVGKELEYRIKNMVDQVGSEKKVEEIYGMSIGKIKILLKEDLVKKMKSDKLKRKKFQGSIKVSDKEVTEFYAKYRDSLPPSKDEYELAHIYMHRKVTDAEKRIAKEKAQIILDSLKQGADFSELAKRNSDDTQSAINGGDLGYSKKGVFVKEFEEALYSINVGGISEIVETEYGYHIIKLNEKKGDLVKSQHILVAYPKLESSDLETISFLKVLKSKIENKSLTFEDASKQFSQDISSNQKGGYLGFVQIDRLDSLTIDAIKDLDSGKISNPIKTSEERNYGFEVIKVLKKIPTHKLTIENDYDKIKRLAILFKENTEMEKWIEEIKKTVYVDVKY